MKTPLASTDISTADHKKFDKVIEKFDAFFRVRKNVIFERAKFNQRIQGPDESVEQFITCLYSLSDTCKYGNLRDEMIRDRIVVGIRDRSLSERLQLDAGLTLESAKTRARQREAVHEQQSVLRNAPKQEVAVDWVSRKPPRRPSYKPRPPDSGQCSRCGKERHPRNVCPAKDAICHKCTKKVLSHYSSQCRSKVVMEVAASPDEDATPYDTSYLDTVGVGQSHTTWSTTIAVNGQKMSFKFDTGAEVTVLSDEALILHHWKDASCRALLKDCVGQTVSLWRSWVSSLPLWSTKTGPAVTQCLWSESSNRTSLVSRLSRH